MSRLILRIEVFPSLRPPPRGIYCPTWKLFKNNILYKKYSIKVSPLYPKQHYRSVQYGATAPKSTTTVCLVHNFPPPSELLVCYQPHRQTAIPSQKSIYETFLDGREGCIYLYIYTVCDFRGLHPFKDASGIFISNMNKGKHSDQTKLNILVNRTLIQTWSLFS